MCFGCCCGLKCLLWWCLILLLILTGGLVFGFGIYKDGFHKVQNRIHHNCVPKFGSDLCGRRTYGFISPSPSPF